MSAALTSEQQYSPMCELHNRSIFFRLRRRRSHRCVTIALPVPEYLLDTFEYVLDTLIGYSVFALPVPEYLLDTDPLRDGEMGRAFPLYL